ncbi:unnamed protein product [Lathyrus sativus]|nr:unnamed protein product [Lathyrus sativus]
MQESMKISSNQRTPSLEKQAHGNRTISNLLVRFNLSLHQVTLIWRVTRGSVATTDAQCYSLFFDESNHVLEMLALNQVVACVFVLRVHDDFATWKVCNSFVYAEHGGP